MGTIPALRKKSSCKDVEDRFKRLTLLPLTTIFLYTTSSVLKYMMFKTMQAN
jgi:hypothetical protein